MWSIKLPARKEGVPSAVCCREATWARLPEVGLEETGREVCSWLVGVIFFLYLFLTTHLCFECSVNE